jgi:VWFA-related protein
VVLAVAAGPACAATARAGQSGTAPPSVGATVRVVEVDLVAEDEQGHPVRDLTAGDLAVLDEGREEPIVSLSGPPAPSGVVRPPALPPGTFSNHVERKLTGGASVMAVLFDGLNTPQARRSYAREKVIAFLRAIPPGTVVSLYTLGRGIGVLRDFSSDPVDLARALQGYRGEPVPETGSAPLELADAGLERFSFWLEELDQNLFEHYARDRALRTIRCLVAIAQHLQRVPGRKSLVWVSGSFPSWVGRDSVPRPRPPTRGKQSFEPEIDRAARVLAASGLAIYPVDARGLRAPAEYDSGRARIDRDIKMMDRSEIATMEALAARTGGRAFSNTNDIEGALRAAAEDAGAAYRLGFEPSHDEWNGEFRRIEVRTRRPGVRLRHRSGYFAQPDAPTDAWYRAAALEAALWDPIDATGLGLTVRATSSGKDALDLDIRVQADDLTLSTAEKAAGTLDVWFVQFGPDDARLGTVSSVAEVRLPSGGRRAGDVPLRTRVKRAKEAVRLRVLVRDVATGALGAVSIPLDAVPAARSR